MKTKKMIPVCVPHLPKSVADAAYETIMSGWIGQNKIVDEFEKKFTSTFNLNHALAVNSCTSALRLALHLARVRPNDGVITTPNTFEATNTAILEQFAKPIFADIQYETGNIDPESIENLLKNHNPSTYGDYIPNMPPIKAIMIVHWMGYPSDNLEIYKIAENYDIPVIEDCAQAIGATYEGKPIGNNSYGCFSFQTVKQITTGDGGMFTTNAKFNKALKASWFGYLKEERSLSAKTGICYYNVDDLGFKYRMNAISASMGIEQLNHINFLLSVRRYNEFYLREHLEGVKGLTLFEQKKDRVGSAYMLPVHVDRRVQFLKTMRDKGIEAFVHNFRNDRHSVFGGIRNLPNMKKFDETAVCLPCHHALTKQDVDYIIKTIKEGW